MRRIWPMIALVVLVIACLRELVFTDYILGRGDTFVYFYPYWTVRDAFLSAGTLPLWTPNLFTGVPLLANPQVGALYPPNWLTIPLNAPDSVRVSVLLHVMFAAFGAYLLGRRVISLQPASALVVGGVFGLGGYVGAHVEQINQLQGLAWLPWLFLLLHLSLDRPLRYVPLLGAGLALQFLSGHTQTVFIGGVGMLVYLVAIWRLRGLFVLVVAAAIALVLASPQLIPTLELVNESGREGGLSANAALSFSFSPFVVGRGLLPSYDGKLFSEYIAYVGVIGLMLAIWGALTRHPLRRAGLALVGVGFFLALGVYNPANWLIVQLPGFDLFRVPARWLALVVLGLALLAGIGTEALWTRKRSWPVTVISILIVLALAAMSFLTLRVPEEVNGPAAPTLRTLAGWGVALAALVGLLFLPVSYRKRAIAPLVFVELCAASWVLPYNDLVPPEVWRAQRLTISQMMAETHDENPPARLMSISGLFFDPGDQATLSARYQALGLTPLEERYSFVAAKLKETLSPNLPLAWDVPTIDGFGGGLLPTRGYNQLMEQVYPDEVPVDGRLRENLAVQSCRGACIPGDETLDTLGVGYLLVDKVFDVWHADVAYDTTFTALDWTAPTPFMATEIRVAYLCAPDCRDPELEDGTLLPPINATFPDDETLRLARHTFDAPTRVEQVRLGGQPVRAVTVVDARTGAFLQLAPQGWTRVLSSDIKLYRRASQPPRAVLSGEGAAAILDYTPTRVELEAENIANETLTLRDAYYPGWRATIDGNPVEIVRTNENYRVVSLPDGVREVIFEYRPWWLPGIFVFGGLMWLLLFAITITIWRKASDDGRTEKRRTNPLPRDTR